MHTELYSSHLGDLSAAETIRNKQNMKLRTDPT
jgi:hypothetical protein